MGEAIAGSLLEATADIVAAHVGNNHVAVGEIAGLIARVHAALAGLGEPAPEPEAELKPAVPIRSSVKPDHMVCLEDGLKFKMLKRHLRVDHQLTPEQYRARWNLPAHYPMVAPDYAEQRRSLAIQIGLGRNPGAKRKPRTKGS